jgi:hypothetical protein
MCLKLEKNNEQRFSFVGVFSPTEPMHLISVLSFQARYTLSKLWSSLSIPRILQVNVLTYAHAH